MLFRPLATRLCFALAPALLLLLSACAPATITASWSAPSYEHGDIRSILVIGLTKNDTLRRAFEDAMVERLEQFGLKAEPSYRTVSADDLSNKEDMAGWVEDRDADGVLVSRIVESRTERIVTPGSFTTTWDDWPYYWRRSYWSGIDPYRGWYPYYSRSYEIIHEPPVVREVRIVTIETTLYDIGTDQPVWSVRAEMNPDDVTDARIERFADQLIDNMMEKGVL